MIGYKLLRVLFHLAVGLWTCALIFPLTDGAGRSRRIKLWSGKLLAICAVQVELRDVAGAQFVPRALTVANHVSWLDIFVLNSLHPCRFVAKADIRDWPLIGWLCARTGTVFIARGSVRDVRRIYEDLVASIEAGDRVAFFPEGTTVGQGTVLPFHANLFEAAIDAQVPIQPYALRYLDTRGDLHPTVDFVGEMTFVQSMLAILQGQKIIAQLTLLPTIESAGAHRRDLARRAHGAVAAALGYPALAASPAADTADNPPAAAHDYPAVQR